MKGTFKITMAYLEGLGACKSGLAAFGEAYPKGGEYQEVLNRCCAEGHIDWAMWLLLKVGNTEDMRFYEEEISDDKRDIVFAGSIEFKFEARLRNLIAGRDIKAGEFIKAGGCIKAGEFIEAGCGIEAGWFIEAGRDIKAGEFIKAGGFIKAGEFIEAGRDIKAGGFIEAGGFIKAGGFIEAGEGIEAGEDIKAGDGYGIFAGIRIKISFWAEYANVRAKSKPKNLISGYWDGHKCGVEV